MCVSFHSGRKLLKQKPRSSAAGNSPQRLRRFLAKGVELLYEDRDILVVYKPAGLLSVAAEGEKEHTLYWILSEYLRKKGEKRRAAAVHRLDRDTSGVMVFSKSGLVKKKFMGLWNELVLKRRYIALTEGVMASPDGVIDAPLGEDRGGRVIIDKNGKKALTRWILRESGSAYSLLELELETGRRNQIRVHLSHIGHPVAGDRKYGAKTDPLGRLCLHADCLVFKHPLGGKIMEFERAEPKEFRAALRKL
jgi:23S rRNA pseudouridine1911/1915/1917 synthase